MVVSTFPLATAAGSGMTYAPEEIRAAERNFIYLGAYDLYSPVHNVWMRAYPLLAPNGTRLSDRCHFTGPKKLENWAQPPPTSPRNGYARIQNIMHGAV
jgi:hypothetical protein